MNSAQFRKILKDQFNEKVTPDDVHIVSGCEFNDMTVFVRWYSPHRHCEYDVFAGNKVRLVEELIA